MTWNNGVCVTNTTQTAYPTAPGGYRYVTNTAPDGSYAVSTYQNGLLLSVTRKDANNQQLSSVSYGYDSQGRQNLSADARTGTTTSFFNSADQVSGTVQSGQVTTNFFDNMGRIVRTMLPDNTSVTNQYSLTGLLTNTYGSRTYPVAYTYDAQGRMKTMTTWQNAAGNSGAATTIWNYNAYRGWLASKLYPDNTSLAYTYTPGGKLLTRVWARGITTTYGYNNAGHLSTITSLTAAPMSATAMTAADTDLHQPAAASPPPGRTTTRATFSVNPGRAARSPACPSPTASINFSAVASPPRTPPLHCSTTPSRMMPPPA